MKTATNKKETAKTNSKSNSTTKTTTKAGVTKPKSDAASGLTELFEDGLKDIYWAEKALVKALPKMAKNATTQGLIDGITNHITETEEQIVRLEQVFQIIGITARVFCQKNTATQYGSDYYQEFLLCFGRNTGFDIHFGNISSNFIGSRTDFIRFS